MNRRGTIRDSGPRSAIAASRFIATRYIGFPDEVAKHKGKPKVNIGICTGPDQAAKAKAAGADFIEAHVQNFLKPTDNDAAFEPSLRAAEASPLPIRAANCFLPASLKSAGPDYQLQPILDYAAVAFRRAERVGITRIVFGSGGSRALPEGFSQSEAFDQFTELLGGLGPIAETHGVTLVVEPLGPECNFIKTLEEGASVVHRVDHPAIRLLADSYHMIRIDEPGGKIAPVASLIAHVHVAEEQGRRAPGVSGQDFTPYLKPLAEAGYAGGISMECKWPDGLAADAARAVEVLREQGATAGLT